jgi:hypothetical protein
MKTSHFCHSMSSRSIQCGALALIWFACLSCRGGNEDLDKAILKFPKLAAADYRVDVAVESANTLIRAGQASACAAFHRIASQTQGNIEMFETNERMCLLCRLLFLPTNLAEPLRGPRLGGSNLLPYDSMKSGDWPYLPFDIVDGVPLSLSMGYALQGMPETPERYLAYCEKNGTFRLQPFPTPSAVTVSNALVKVFTSRWKSLQWEPKGPGRKYKLNEAYAKEMLWKQVENMPGNGPGK